MLQNFTSTQGSDPQMSGLQAVLSLYEREVGPMPEKVGHVKKMWFLIGRER